MKLHLRRSRPDVDSVRPVPDRLPLDTVIDLTGGNRLEDVLISPSKSEPMQRASSAKRVRHRSRASARYVVKVRIIHTRSPLPPVRRQIKAVLDRALSLAFIGVTWPLIGVVAVAIKLDSSGPVLSSETFIGKHGTHFTKYSFRTTDENTKTATRIGHLIRRLNLDTLPQLLNVVRGDMSLVGPRAATPQEVMTYDAIARQRLRVRPGITGPWRIHARPALSFEEMLALDNAYWMKWSLRGDVRIICKTPRVLFDRERTA